MDPRVKDQTEEPNQTEEAVSVEAEVSTEEPSIEELFGEKKQILSTEGKEQPEELSLEDITSPKTDIQKAKDGTPPGIQKRIDKLVAERNEALKKLKEVEAKAFVANKPVVPIRDNFEDDESYQEAFDNYIIAKPEYDKAKELLSESAATRESEIAELAQRLKTQVDELQEKFPNVDIAKTIRETDWGTAEAAIESSSQNGKIAYYFARNPSELKKLNALSSTEIYKEIGKLEARIMTASKKEITNAPKPLDTLKGGTETVTPVKSLYKIKDSNEWFKARNREILEKRNRAT